MNISQDLNETQYKGRTILLDLSVDKKKYESAKGQTQTPKNTSDEKEDLEPEEEKTAVKSKPNHRPQSKKKKDFDEEEEEEDDVDADDERDDQEEDEEEEDDDEAEKNSDEEEEERPPEDMSNTIFVRNISYEVREPEFKKFWQTFGHIFYAKVSINREYKIVSFV